MVSSTTPSLMVLIGSTLTTLSTVTLDQSFDSWLSNIHLISGFPCTHAQSILRQFIVKSSSYFEFSLHPRSINPSTVDCQIFILFRIFPAPTLDQSFGSWLSNLPLISNIPWTHQLIVPIHSWSNINQSDILLSKLFLWFRFFFPLPIDNGPWSSAVLPGLLLSNISLVSNLSCNHQLIVTSTPDQSSITLVFCCQNSSSSFDFSFHSPSITTIHP